MKRIFFFFKSVLKTVSRIKLYAMPEYIFGGLAEDVDFPEPEEGYDIFPHVESPFN